MTGEAYPLKGGIITRDRRLDRVPQFDPRSRQYNVRLVTPLREPRSYSWFPGDPLDQGGEGECVGFGVACDLAARPVVVQGVIGIHVGLGGSWYIVRNSWGPNWGITIQIGRKFVPGCAFISRGTMARRLKAQGECCIPTIRSMPVDPVWS